MMSDTMSGVRQYQWLVWTAVVMLCLDLCFNSTVLLFSHSTLISLVIYIIQDVCLIFSIILISVATFSTSLLKMGLLKEAVRRVRWSALGMLSYLALSIGFHTVSLQQQWHEGDTYVWSDPMLAFFSIQRIAGGIHYYLFKRALFRLSDDKFYQ
ncbi:transmembrane protein 138 [Hyalella azteca]|uniref:Transmembrane protein 138 n=1 Tax=Hyalella azteca TaxID=294128 RepID=A0A8B7NPY7_HYAAZ|nr:transmembrane protein 138 [Hyalella azteca]